MYRTGQSRTDTEEEKQRNHKQIMTWREEELEGEELRRISYWAL